MAQFTQAFGNQIDVTGQTVSFWESAVAALGDGRTAVSWTQDGNLAVWVRIYDADGNPEGAAIKVTAENEEGNRPSISVADDGTFTVTYTSLPEDVSSAILSRGFASDGTPLNQLNAIFADSNGVAVSPETTILSNGNIVTVFNAFDSDVLGTAARLSGPDGTPLGQAFVVNQTINGLQFGGVPFALDDGGFVVTWESSDVDGSFQAVLIRSFNADGTPRGGEAQVNQYTLGFQRNPDVTVLSDGSFVVTWESQDLNGTSQDGSGDGIYARLYSASGVAQGNEFQVNTTADFDQNLAAISATPDGGFVVAWSSEPTGDAAVTDIRFQKFDSAGAKVGAETVLAESPAGAHAAPDIVIGDDGVARVVWNLIVQDSAASTVFLQTVDLNVLATTGDDVIAGTSGDDYLGGQGGSDVINGGAGDDILLGDDFEVGYTLPQANQIFRLYQATFNRAPDAAGHDRWTSDLFTETSTLADVREGFVGSQEFQNIYAGLNDADFVKELYINVLDRDFNQGEVTQQEIDNWTNRINNDFTRADVVNGFAESQQLINNTNQAANKLAVNSAPAVWSDEVYRLYQATLDRAPDLNGFENWSERLADGQSLTDVITGFTGSQEFFNIYGALTDVEDFVKLLYLNVLDRDFDQGEVTQAEVNGWTSQLSETFTRANIVQGFSQSQEFIIDSAADVKAYVRAQGVDDVINGGAGTNVLAGGALADTFVFDQNDSGSNTVLDLEAWDFVSFEGFGYNNVADARAHLTQSGNDVVFSDQGTDVTIEDYLLSNLTNDMILV